MNMAMQSNRTAKRTQMMNQKDPKEKKWNLFTLNYPNNLTQNSKLECLTQYQNLIF